MSRQSSIPRRGFTLVELLMALALTAVLLTSMAAAMKASFDSFDQDQKIADATQTARTILGRISNDIRAADAVQVVNAGKVSIIPVANTQNLTLIEYTFANGALKLARTVNGVVTTSTLLDNAGDVRVNSFALTSALGTDAHGVTCTRSVTAKLVITLGNQQFSVTSSASPRRNQTF